MDRHETLRALRRVGTPLDEQRLVGEILLLGGAYMTLVLRQREATKDVDAYFASSPDAIRLADSRAAGELDLPEDWLNDAAKGFLWLEVPGLRVCAPTPAYVSR